MGALGSRIMTLFLFVSTPAAIPATTQSGNSEASAQVVAPAIVDLPVSPDGASRVWLNTLNNRYRCSYERQYGRSRKGEYLTEKQAKDRGARPANGKGCPSR